ncbi:MAG: NAD-dependent malic enzyme, partial [Gammaproteobacteria bacterium]|nr:NAD-dependent malic enzyme [Gammaproteobacteria bacterium]
MSKKPSKIFYKTKCLTGDQLLNNSKLNKGTAFTRHERSQFKLLGKLPYKVETITQQAKRTYQQFKTLSDLKQKRLFLFELYNANQTLFYNLVSSHLDQMIPIIYTPQVADTCS